MTPKQIRELIIKREGRYTNYDKDIEAWVIFPKIWSLTKCRRYLNVFVKYNKFRMI